MNKKYDVWNFIFDLILISITGGWWFVWMLFRFLNKNS